jgi:DNA-directed RNA polymerase specialized sigma24 family protein
MNKDHKCQKILYDHYRGYALKISFRYLYRYEKAVDAVNDGFVKLFNHFPGFNIGADADNERILMAWLKKIMVNTSIDALRKSNMLPEIGGIPEHLWNTPDDSSKADILSNSVGTSKSSLSRARTLLQISIKKMEDKIQCRM